MVSYYWYKRVYCPSCNSYIWTTGINQGIVCSCNSSYITDTGQLEGDSQEVINNNDFENYVKDDINNQNVIILSVI